MRIEVYFTHTKREQKKIQTVETMQFLGRIFFTTADSGDLHQLYLLKPTTKNTHPNAIHNTEMSVFPSSYSSLPQRPPLQGNAWSQASPNEAFDLFGDGRLNQKQVQTEVSQTPLSTPIPRINAYHFFMLPNSQCCLCRYSVCSRNSPQPCLDPPKSEWHA